MEHDFKADAPRSAIPLIDLLHANVSERVRPRQRHRSITVPDTRATSLRPVHPAVDDCPGQSLPSANGEPLADSAIGLPAYANSDSEISRSIVGGPERRINDCGHDTHPISGKSRVLVPSTLVNLLRQVQVKQLEGSQQLHIFDDDTTSTPTEYDDCDVPCDGDRCDCNSQNANFAGLPPAQDGGFGNVGWHENVQRPFGGGQGNGQNGGPGGGSNETSDGVTPLWPCVFCRFHAREDDPTRNCCKKKKRISHLL